MSCAIFFYVWFSAWGPVQSPLYPTLQACTSAQVHTLEHALTDEPMERRFLMVSPCYQGHP